MAEAAVGSRCICEGYYGTVRFIGAVPPTSGDWFGVEWDDSSRGRHDGTKDGVRYFHCSKPGNCGSFVRVKKLEFGYTYKQALEKKYGEAHKEEDIAISKSKKVEMFGFDKQAEFLSDFGSLQIVDLRDTMLSRAGLASEVSMTTPLVTALDLSENLLLSSWKEVANIVRELPCLKKLLLSYNRLTNTPSDEEYDYKTAFKGITTLSVNKMDIDWTQLSHMLSLMISLEELHVCENNIASLRNGNTAVQVFPPSLRLLNLEENLLSDWNEILQLQHLPNLECLVLNDNQLTSIGDINEGSFPSLHTLSITQTKISEWTGIDNLNRLKRLEHLKFNGSPLHENEHPFFSRQLTIARLPSIKLLNSSQITNNERKESERYYIKKYVKEWLLAESKQTMNDFIKLHPLYPQHVKVHGLPPDVSVNSTAIAPVLKNRLIAVSISCPDRPELVILNKKLPDSMTVQKLKGLLQRVYKINASDQLLSYKSHKMSDSKNEIEMNDDLKQLTYYSLESNDHVLLRTT